MQSINKYPKYKPSGIPWLGDVPDHWECSKLRSILFSVSKKNCPNLPLLSVVREKGVIVRNISDDSENHNVIPEDLTNYKVVNPGQFAMNKMKAWQGSYGISKFEGIVSPAYFVFNLRKVEPSFFHVAMRSKVLIPFFAAASDGIRVGQWDLSMSRMREIPFFVPLKTEQTQIARFLNWKTSQINKFIKAKKRILELLKEQIDLYLYGKIETSDMSTFLNWDNSFPEVWQLTKAKRLFSEINIKNQSDKELLAVTQDRGVVLKKECLQNYVSPSGSLDGLKLVRENDFVISLRSFQGGIEYSNYEGIVSPAYNIIYLNRQYNSSEYQKYFKYLFKTKPFISQLNTIISGIRDGKNINYSDFAEILLPLPPIDYLKSFMHLLDNFESYKQRFQIEKMLLDEFKNRLISDVVTGKVDVRDIEVPEVIEYIEEDILEKENEELEEMEGEIDNV